MATFFSALGVVAWALDRGTAFSARELAGGLAAYWITAALGGLLLGVCRPLAARRAGALTVGAVIGVLFVLAVMVCARGPAVLVDGRIVIACAAFGVPLGAACAEWTWWRQRTRGLTSR